MAKTLYRADDTTWEARVPRRASLRLTMIGLFVIGVAYLLDAARGPLETSYAVPAIVITAIRGALIIPADILLVGNWLRILRPRTVRGDNRAFTHAPELSEQVRDIIHRYLAALALTGDQPLTGDHLGLHTFITAQERLATTQHRNAASPGRSSQRRYEKARAAAAEAQQDTLSELDRFEQSQATGERTRRALRAEADAD